MQDLLGKDRIDEQNSTWGDSFIMNFGLPEYEGEEKVIHPHDLDRKSTRLNSSHSGESRMPSSA